MASIAIFNFKIPQKLIKLKKEKKTKDIYS